MPPESFNWDRKDLSKGRRRERSLDPPLGHVSRWRESPRHGTNSPREYNRWSNNGGCRSRASGHGKQGCLHRYPEQPSYGQYPLPPCEGMASPCRPTDWTIPSYRSCDGIGTPTRPSDRIHTPSRPTDRFTPQRSNDYANTPQRSNDLQRSNDNWVGGTQYPSIDRARTPRHSIDRVDTLHIYIDRARTPRQSIDRVDTPHRSIYGVASPHHSFDRSTATQRRSNDRVNTPQHSNGLVCTPQRSNDSWVGGTQYPSIDRVGSPHPSIDRARNPRHSIDRVDTRHRYNERARTPRQSIDRVDTPHRSIYGVASPHHSFDRSTATQRRSNDCVNTPQRSNGLVCTPQRSNDNWVGGNQYPSIDRVGPPRPSIDRARKVASPHRSICGSATPCRSFERGTTTPRHSSETGTPSLLPSQTIAPPLRSSDNIGSPFHSSEVGITSLLSSEKIASPYCSREKIVDGETVRFSEFAVDGRCNRNSDGCTPRDLEAHPLENSGVTDGSGNPPNVNAQKLVSDMPTDNSLPRSDSGNAKGELHPKDPRNKIHSVSALGMDQRLERGGSLGSIDWKLRPWTRYVSARSSSLMHLSGPKSSSAESSEGKAEVQDKIVNPVETHTGDPSGSVQSAALSENPRKKPRVRWGEGLVEYEKKRKAVVSDDSATMNGGVDCCSIEASCSDLPNLADKSPRFTSFPDSASLITPSSVGYSSSPGIEKQFPDTSTTDNATSKNSGSQDLPSSDIVEAKDIDLESLDATAIANINSSLRKLVHHLASEDSSFVRATALNKLQVWKGSVIKALEMTESEIDSLEDELKSLVPDTGISGPSPVISSSLLGNTEVKTSECQFVGPDSISQVAGLQFVSSVNPTVKDKEEVPDPLGGEGAVSPVTVTSKLTGRLSSSITLELEAPICASESPIATRLRSARKNCANPQQSWGSSFRTLCGSNQKHVSSVHSPFSPGGHSNAVPSGEVINFTKKLISGWQYKPQRKDLRMAAILPAMVLDKKEKVALQLFVSNDGLVQDPCAVEKERALINPWTREEKDIFIDKLVTFGKEFRKIASFLDHKTTADCVEFYYKNHKSDCFREPMKKEKEVEKLELAAQEKLKKEGIWETVAASLGAVSTVADNPKHNTKNQKNFLWTASSYRAPQRDDDSTERLFKVKKLKLAAQEKSKKEGNRETNAASLGAVSTVAANPDHNTKNPKNYLAAASSYRAPQHDDDSTERLFKVKKLKLAAQEKSKKEGNRETIAASLGAVSTVAANPDHNTKNPKNYLLAAASSYRAPQHDDDSTERLDNSDAFDDDTCSDVMDGANWTDEEKLLFVQALKAHGKDFATISKCMKTKSEKLCAAFFTKTRGPLRLDIICSSSGAGCGGCDSEDAGGLPSGSAICREKPELVSAHKMDVEINNCSEVDEDPVSRSNAEQLMKVDMVEVNLDSLESNPATTINVLPGTSGSEDDPRAGKIDFEIPELEEGHVTADVLVRESNRELNCVGICPLFGPPHNSGEDGDTGLGHVLEQPVTCEVSVDHNLTVSATEGETIAGKDYNGNITTDTPSSHCERLLEQGAQSTVGFEKQSMNSADADNSTKLKSALAVSPGVVSCLIPAAQVRGADSALLQTLAEVRADLNSLQGSFLQKCNSLEALNSLQGSFLQELDDPATEVAEEGGQLDDDPAGEVGDEDGQGQVADPAGEVDIPAVELGDEDSQGQLADPAGEVDIPAGEVGDEDGQGELADPAGEVAEEGGQGQLEDHAGEGGQLDDPAGEVGDEDGQGHLDDPAGEVGDEDGQGQLADPAGEVAEEEGQGQPEDHAGEVAGGGGQGRRRSTRSRRPPVRLSEYDLHWSP